MQRACIDAAASGCVAGTGEVWEVGLGNGRTYDHLVDRFEGRDIVVFDRHVMAHPDCIPPDAMLRLGDFHQTIPAQATLRAGTVAVIHADIGSGDIAQSRALGRSLASHFVRALGAGGFLIGDQPMDDPLLAPITLADVGAGDVPADAYFLYRKKV